MAVGVQKGYFHFGVSSFEIHRDLGKVYYSAWELRNKLEHQLYKKQFQPTIEQMKDISEDVHMSLKNWRQSGVVPHHQVLIQE